MPSSLENQLEPFKPSNFKYTEPPNPDWKIGEGIEATPEGREWMKGLESGWQIFDTSQLEPRKLYSILISGIVPRPVAFVSSVSEDGVENLGLFSWFNQVSPVPPVLSISCSNLSTRVKDTVRNIKATKGFTVNIISEPWIQQANICSIDAPPEVSEWRLSGLTKEPSLVVKAPRVRESAFSMECELFQAIDIVEPNTLKSTNTLILGYIKYIHVRKDVIEPVRGIVDIGKLKPIVRLEGASFAKLGDGYRIPRKVWADSLEEIEGELGEDYVNGKENEVVLK